jgi:hypothetical protein
MSKKPTVDVQNSSFCVVVWKHAILYMPPVNVAGVTQPATRIRVVPVPMLGTAFSELYVHSTIGVSQTGDSEGDGDVDRDRVPVMEGVPDLEGDTDEGEPLPVGDGEGEGVPEGENVGTAERVAHPLAVLVPVPLLLLEALPLPKPAAVPPSPLLPRALALREGAGEELDECDCCALAVGAAEQVAAGTQRTSSTMPFA